MKKSSILIIVSLDILLLLVPIHTVAQDLSTVIRELFDSSEKAMFNFNYDKAIDDLAIILDKDPKNYKAKLYLAELHLLKGLQNKTTVPEKAKDHLLLSLAFSERMRNIFKDDLGAIFYQAMASLTLGELSEEIKNKQYYYTKALKLINSGIDINFDDEHIWFAQGEWWYQIAQWPLEERKAFLNQINKQFFGNLSERKRIIYEFSLDAYKNTLCYRSSSTYGLYGIIKVLLALNRCEEAEEYYEQVLHFSNYYPLQHYYVQQTEETWGICRRDTEMEEEEILYE